jgi:hypothetical protein
MLTAKCFGGVMRRERSPIDSDPTQRLFTRFYRAWLLFVLFILSALNLADRQGMAAVAPPIKRDLALSDTRA